MKLNRSILTAALLALTGSAALALTVPAQQDTTATSGKFLKGAGAANTLSVSSKQAAYIQFNFLDAGIVPLTIQPSNITSANLRIFVGKAKVPGDLELHAVTGPWSEGVTGTAPAIDPAVIKTFPADLIATKDFVTVDVTEAIRAALANVALGLGDNGFAITAAGTTKVTLGSKEGAASGYPCELNIETNYASDGSGGGIFNGSGSFGVNVQLDGGDNNDGGLTGALLFGSAGLEGIGSKRTAGGNQFGLDFYSEGVSRMSITNGGFVGIGTTLPDSILHLLGSGDTELTIQSADNNRHWTLQASGGDEAGGGTAGTFQIVDRTETASRLAISPSGNVGIGTTEPFAKLEVHGDVKLGPLGTRFAASGSQNLYILRGLINADSSQANGGGFDAVRTFGGNPVGDYTILYEEAFADAATVTASTVSSAGNATAVVVQATPNQVRIKTFAGGAPADTLFNFIAVGKR